MAQPSTIYLIPTFLDEHAADVLPAYLLEALQACKVFFVEDERTARRFAKRLWKEMVIDNYEWYPIHKAEEQVKALFKTKIAQGQTIGIISEAGCPGVADPGQILVAVAHQAGAYVKPLVGPSSILLGLMASGMNGQDFHFSGYLPIQAQERIRKIRELENESKRKGSTEIFIETPYRNNQLRDALVNACQGSTRLCIATGLTSGQESIRTLSIADWKRQLPDLHKKPTVFLLMANPL
jgi:16S rRNA (cytidine1402-2'-O)-methyltransferase